MQIEFELFCQVTCVSILFVDSGLPESLDLNKIRSSFMTALEPSVQSPVRSVLVQVCVSFQTERPDLRRDSQGSILDNVQHFRLSLRSVPTK